MGEPISSPNRVRSSRNASSNGTVAGTSRTCGVDTMRDLHA
jgi:hypothetical protein